MALTHLGQPVVRPVTPPVTTVAPRGSCPVAGQTVQLFWRCGFRKALVCKVIVCDGGGAYPAGTRMLVLWYGAHAGAGRPEAHVSYARFAPDAGGAGRSALVESIVPEGEEEVVEIELEWEVADEEVEFTALEMEQLTHEEVEDYGEEMLRQAATEFGALPRNMQQAMLAGETSVVVQQRQQVDSHSEQHGARPFPSKAARPLKRALSPTKSDSD